MERSLIYLPLYFFKKREKYLIFPKKLYIMEGESGYAEKNALKINPKTRFFVIFYVKAFL